LKRIFSVISIALADRAVEALSEYW